MLLYMYQPWGEVSVKLINTALKRGFEDQLKLWVHIPGSLYASNPCGHWHQKIPGRWQQLTQIWECAGSVLGVSLHFHIRDTLNISLRADEAKDISIHFRWSWWHEDCVKNSKCFVQLHHMINHQRQQCAKNWEHGCCKHRPTDFSM